MKKRFQKCENCGEETSHSYKKVLSAHRGKLRREVIRCNQCGKKSIKNTKKGSYVIAGKNETGGEE